MKKLNKFKFNNLQEAWEGLNEWMVNNESKIIEGNGASYGTEIVAYDNIIQVEDCRIDKNFNFGKALGYKDKKWSKLLNNYVDYNYLDIVATEIKKREESSRPHYNNVFHFSNKFGSGKDCLISITFSRRKTEDVPVVIFKTRASEITKRLIFDFLLVQRICEYIYGKNQRVKAIIQIDFMYIVLECFQMYLAHYGVNILNYNNQSKETHTGRPRASFIEKLLKKRQFFLDTPLEKITFMVHKRAAAQVKRDPKTGGPLANCPDLFAKDLKLFHAKKFKVKDIEELNKSL